MKKIVFLDRDGTINIEKSYLHKWEDFEFEKNAIAGLIKLKDMGFEFIVVTNQSGIARGYYTEEDLILLNSKMTEKLKEYDINILDCYYCPHHPEKGVGEYKIDCSCRKPEPGMLLKGIDKYDVDLKKSYIVGDKLSDLEAGERVGIKSILVKTGYGKNIVEKCQGKYDVAEDLLDVAKIIEKIEK